MAWRNRHRRPIERGLSDRLGSAVLLYAVVVRAGAVPAYLEALVAEAAIRRGGVFQDQHPKCSQLTFHIYSAFNSSLAPLIVLPFFPKVPMYHHNRDPPSHFL